MYGRSRFYSLCNHPQLFTTNNSKNVERRQSSVLNLPFFQIGEICRPFPPLLHTPIPIIEHGLHNGFSFGARAGIEPNFCLS
ncbi:hypothetical protein ACET3Z_001423 [Daucus carota]